MLSLTIPSFVFGLFFVSVISSKLLRLWIYWDSVPLAAFVVYLPTCLITDVLVIAGFRVLLRRDRVSSSFTSLALSSLLSLLALAAAACEVGFFFRTGAELQWAAGRAVVKDRAGLAVLLSESTSVYLAAVALSALTILVHSSIYEASGHLLAGLTPLWKSAWLSISTLWRHRHGNWNNYTVVGHGEDQLEEAKPQRSHQRADSVWKRLTQLKSLTSLPWLVLVSLICLLLIRPSKPYNHMSMTLPVAVLDFVAPPSSPANTCEGVRRIIANEWPRKDLISQSSWKDRAGYFKGWAPQSTSPLIAEYHETQPEWLPSPVPSGFHRWDSHSRKSNTTTDDHTTVLKDNSSLAADSASDTLCASGFLLGNDYNPVDDPLRISNLDLNVLEPLRDAILKNDVKIRHVVLITMESLRKDVFPLKQGSPIHKLILETHPEGERESINKLLAELTPNAERITGQKGGFTAADGTPYTRNESSMGWHNSTQEGFGGVSASAFSSSSLSVKSFIGSHCGVWPLPVDTLEEAESPNIYQPCLPQLFDLFNGNKGKTTNADATKDTHNLKWSSQLFQAVTETFDRQNVMDRKMGFTKVVSSTQLAQDALSKPDMKTMNYFGYADTYLRPHLDSYMTESLANDERMFLSHFTSLTHHPWDLPEDWPTKQYVAADHEGQLPRRRHFNSYLNTVSYHDRWLGEILQMIEDKGIADQTLVVMVGDHGMTFIESQVSSTAAENPHIGTFSVPLVIRHPRLPLVQYEETVSPTSVVPTILDLLVSTGSLNEKDTEAAKDLIHEYEGQSLIRPYKADDDGRRAWNFGVVNLGGRMLSVTSADTQWRLVMPVNEAASVEYQLTDYGNDPLEKDGIKAWDIGGLVEAVQKKLGGEAAKWATEAEVIAKWWILERKRLWKYGK